MAKGKCTQPRLDMRQVSFRRCLWSMCNVHMCHTDMRLLYMGCVFTCDLYTHNIGKLRLHMGLMGKCSVQMCGESCMPALCTLVSIRCHYSLLQPTIWRILTRHMPIQYMPIPLTPTWRVSLELAETAHSHTAHVHAGTPIERWTMRFTPMRHMATRCVTMPI